MTELRTAEQQEVESFQDIAKREGIPLTLTPLTELLDEEIVVKRITLQESQYGLCLSIVGSVNGMPFKALTSSGVVKESLEMVKDHLPIRCTISKQGRYYVVK